MSITRCTICYNPVSMKPERAEDRKAHEEGWAHVRCVDPSPEEQVLAQIFGASGTHERRREAADRLGRQVGHEIKLDRGPAGVWWVCACGLTGPADSSFDKSAAREGGRQHLRDSYIFSTGKGNE